MQRRFPIGWTIFAVSLVTLVWVYFTYLPIESSKLKSTVKTLVCPSDIRLRMTLRYDAPPIFEEVYEMRDADGVSTSSYRVRGYAGKQITVTAPPRQTYDVSFLFGRVVQDGIWKLVDRPTRGNADVHYTLYVRQTALVEVELPGGATSTQCKTGDRTITFTDPHYWAKMAGREYHFDLGKGAPKNANDLMKLQSSSLADPHYEMVVDDFLNFGPESFRSKVAAARATIRASK